MFRIIGVFCEFAGIITHLRDVGDVVVKSSKSN